jgi:hypothetical protein
VLEVVSSGLQTWTNMLFNAHQTSAECFLSDHLQFKDYYYTVHSLASPTGLGLVNEQARPQSPAYYCVTKRTLYTVHRNVCSVGSCTILLKKGISSFIVWQMFRKWCQNLCNISVWTFW